MNRRTYFSKKRRKVTVPVRLVIRGKNLVSRVNPRDKSIVETLISSIEGSLDYHGDLYFLQDEFRSITLRGFLSNGAKELLTNYCYFMGIEEP